MEPIITILTPTYNRAHTLERAYESLCKQTFIDFKWIIMDDGSKDGTKELVEKIKQEAKFPIEYYYHENKHKFITVFKGIEKIKSPYFTILDSDDSYPIDALEILYKEVESITNQDEFIGVIGHSISPDGKVVGDLFPNDGFVGSILEMRYKYKIKGDKNGIFITKSYQNELQQFDYSFFDKKCYIAQKVFFAIYDAKGLKTKFINKNIRIYHFDEDDQSSVTNNRALGKNIFGILEAHKSFLNSYQNQLFKYPMPLIRNIIGYLVYSFKYKVAIKNIFSELKYLPFKILSLVLFIPSFIYSKIK